MAPSVSLSQPPPHGYATRAHGAPPVPPIGADHTPALEASASVSSHRMLPQSGVPRMVPQCVMSAPHTLSSSIYGPPPQPPLSAVPMSDPLRALLSPHMVAATTHVQREQQTPQESGDAHELAQLQADHIDQLSARLESQRVMYEQRLAEADARAGGLGWGLAQAQPPSLAALHPQHGEGYASQRSRSSNYSLPPVDQPPPAPPSVHSLASTTSSADADDELLPVPARALHAGGTGSRPISPRPEIFSYKELASMPCSCKPEAIAGFQTMFGGRLKAKNGAAFKCLTYTEAGHHPQPVDDGVAIEP